MNGLYLNNAQDALTGLLQFYNGNKSQMALGLGVTRVSIHNWLRRGYIGKKIAMVIDKRDDLPFTKEQLRPDVKIWDYYKY